MDLLEPRATERDNQNALRKYPFADAATCGNGACTIVPGALIDAQLYVHGRDPGRVWLSAVGTDGILRFSDAGGVFAETCAPATADTAVPVTFTGNGGPLPGGVVVFGSAADVGALLSLGGQTFTADQGELAPAAVTFTGLPGVSGFLLDDGHVVSGAVRFKGANGCDVATFVDADGIGHIRISALGRPVTPVESTGFITEVAATSDNTAFVVGNFKIDETHASPHVIAILATGVALTQADGLVADQESTCETVRRTRGTLPNVRATVPPNCEDGVCGGAIEEHTVTLMNGDERVGTPFTLGVGESLGTLRASQIPAAPEGQRFAGYFDAATGGRLYYRYDGKGMGRFAATADVTLHARFVEASSSALATFVSYGTLHLAAPSCTVYSNPIRISGVELPVPSVRAIPEDTLAQGGPEALAELVLHPDVPSGEIRIGIRGLEKAHTT